MIDENKDRQTAKLMNNVSFKNRETFQNDDVKQEETVIYINSIGKSAISSIPYQGIVNI